MSVQTTSRGLSGVAARSGFDDVGEQLAAKSANERKERVYACMMVVEKLGPIARVLQTGRQRSGWIIRQSYCFFRIFAIDAVNNIGEKGEIQHVLQQN
jgi:hypothetical protein